MEEQKKKLFTRANLLKILAFYLAFHLLFAAITAVFSTTFMQLFTVKEIGSADFTFNDLYYRVVEKSNFEKAAHFRREKSVLLINTGSLNKDKFRLELAELLLRLEDYEPKVMAIDHEFSIDSLKTGSPELIEAAAYYGNLIFAFDNTPDSNANFMNLGERGTVLFPKQISIRYYKNSDSTFAHKIAVRVSEKVQTMKRQLDSFPIHYSAYGIGFCDWRDDLNKLYDINFKAIEAIDFIEPDSATRAELKKLIKGKALIIGHLGFGNMYNEFDIEDKFKVPVDPLAMSGRERTMPGPVIHANAVENFLHRDGMFFEINGFWFNFIQQLVYLLYLTFILFGSMNKFIKLFILGTLSILSLFFVIEMMRRGIYITMGTTMLQLLVLEELSEMFQPYYKKLEKYFKSRTKKKINESI